LQGVLFCTAALLLLLRSNSSRKTAHASPLACTVMQTGQIARGVLQAESTRPTPLLCDTGTNLLHKQLFAAC
jgi:hypothetical protein